MLITGGCDAGGVVTATCEIYDHTTGTLSPAASMGSGRIGHSATLLNDGRVLVAGGLADYQNADTNLAFVLTSAQDSAELYDPATNMWAPAINSMASVRSGHTAELLADGRVLLISGIDGGFTNPVGTDVPTFTQTCDVFDPATDGFSAVAPIPIGRAFHATSTLGGGDILVTGGLITAGAFGEALATNTCYRFNGTGWSLTGSLPVGVAFHSQGTTDAGDAVVSGGYIGDFVTLIASDSSGSHDGFNFTVGAPLGTNVGLPGASSSPRGSHTLTRLWDGSFLLLGGFNSPDTSTLIVLDDGFVYTP